MRLTELHSLSPRGLFAGALAILILLTAPCHPARAEEEPRYSLNSINLPSEQDEKVTGDYSFLVTGHLYGNPKNRNSPYPAATLLAAIDDINRSGAAFFVSLGDILWSPTKERLESFKRAVSDKIKLPFFNAVGNHEYSEKYKEFFKVSYTYYSFRRGAELFIVLDTESSRGEIAGDQLIFLEKVLAEGESDESVRNIFIFSHKLIWAPGKRRYEGLFKHINSPEGYLKTGAYEKNVEPLLDKVSKDLYFISGDIGIGEWSLPLFYDRVGKRRYMAIGLGDTFRDAILNIEIGGSRVKLKLISLSGLHLDNIEFYDISFWNNYFKEQAIPPVR